jgi:hypothetical protein
MFCSTLAGKGVGVNRKTTGMNRGGGGRGQDVQKGGNGLFWNAVFNELGKTWLTTTDDSNLNPQ